MFIQYSSHIFYFLFRRFTPMEKNGKSIDTNFLSFLVVIQSFIFPSALCWLLTLVLLCRGGEQSRVENWMDVMGLVIRDVCRLAVKWATSAASLWALINLHFLNKETSHSVEQFSLFRLSTMDRVAVLVVE